MNDLGYIKDNIDQLLENINNACIKYGRDRDEILLLPVSKNQPEDKIRFVYDLGFTEFGENRVQELTGKFAALPSDIRWHLIGSLQTNKVKYIVDKVRLIHSADRISLLEEIDKRARTAKITAQCLIQVNISKEDTKSGIDLADIDGFLEQACIFDNVEITGMMAIASFTDNKKIIKTEFESIRRKFVDISSKKMHNIDMKYLSMGMSSDYIEAIECGSNIIRIGTTIFGPRS
jgi:pyridoxal phosphate enzyme (YggS family)